MTHLNHQKQELFDELTYWYWLSSVRFLGPQRCKTLLTLFKKDLSLVWELESEQLVCIRGINDKIARDITTAREWREIFLREAALNRMRAEAVGGRILKLTDVDYPELLKASAVSPPLLFAKGQIERWNTLPGAVAIVGTRNPSSLGTETARRFAAAFAREGWAVVSGLAKGIDHAAHQGALSAEGFTVGVLGCGVDIIYPPESRDIRAAIDQQGAVISEYPFTVQPSALRLKRRNKLTVAMAWAVIVIETSLTGGTMNAVRAAKEQKKLLFALLPEQEAGHSFSGNVHLITTGEAIKLAPDMDVKMLIQYFSSCTAASGTQARISGLASNHRRLATAVSSGQ